MLQDNWIDKVDGVDPILAQDINDIAAAVIENEKKIAQNGSVTVDDALSTTSENPVQNKVLTAAINRKEETSCKQEAFDILAKDSPALYPSVAALYGTVSHYFEKLFPYKTEMMGTLPVSDIALDVIYVVGGEQYNGIFVYKERAERAAYLRITPTYIAGAGPATALYVKDADSIDDVSVGDTLYYSATENITAVSELGNNIFSTVSAIELVGDVIQFTTSGGAVFTANTCSALSLIDDSDGEGKYVRESITAETDLTPYLRSDTLGRIMYDKWNDTVGDIETLLGGI